MDESSESEPLQTRPGPVEAPARLSSERLFGAKREVVIVHNGREYSLRLTRNDKLILTA